MTPPEPSQEPAAYTGERLGQSLVLAFRVAELGLHVDIVDSTVVVPGTVPTEGRRAAVAEVVYELAPGRRMRSDVTVMAPASPGPEEQAEAALMIRVAAVGDQQQAVADCMRSVGAQVLEGEATTIRLPGGAAWATWPNRCCAPPTASS